MSNTKTKLGTSKDKRSVEEIRKAMVGRFAYTAVVEAGNPHYIIGRADFGTRGYTPMRHHHFKTYEEAQKFATEVNEREGLTPIEAAIIVAETMRRP